MANELKRQIQRKIRIDTNAPDTLVSALSVVQSEILRKILRILKKFSLKSGKLSPGSIDESMLIAGMKKDVLGILKNSDYPELIENFIVNFDEVDKLNRQIHKAVNNISLSEITKTLTAEKRSAIDAVAKQLNGAQSLEVNITKPIQQILFRSVQTGSTFADAEEQLRVFIAGDERRGVLQRYVGQIANDALLQYDGAVNQIIQDKFELDAYRYIPGLVRDSRPQCKRWVSELKGVIPLSKLPEEVTWARNNGKGYSTSLVLTVDNFAIVRGGHNCRHTAIPFRMNTQGADDLDQALG